jgi:hypothetical protein
MDTIQQCLSLPPVPSLTTAFSALKFISLAVKQVQVSKIQLKVLTQAIAQLLQTLNDEYREGRLLQATTSTPLANLCRFVNSVTPGRVFIFIVQALGRDLSICSE